MRKNLICLISIFLFTICVFKVNSNQYELQTGLDTVNRFTHHGSIIRPYYVNDAQDLTFWLRSEFLYKSEKKGTVDYWQRPSETVNRHGGDCEDFAFLVQHVMRDLLVRSHVVSIKFRKRKIGHAICVFQEHDATWSYFTNQYYEKVNAETITDLVNQEYSTWQHYNFVSQNKTILLKVKNN